MIDALEIRPSQASDLQSIKAIYRDVFPQEDLLPLVTELLQDPSIARSCVGIVDSLLVGHVLFTRCSVEGGGAKVALLGPLAVASTSQRMGVGRALVVNGLQSLKTEGIAKVFVLGDPNYYGRLGFRQENQVRPPFSLPVEWSGAWQSICVCKTDRHCQGALLVPQPWQCAALWAP